MTEYAHSHQYTTNGDRYRCPVRGCWWTATGVQALPYPPTPAQLDPRLRDAMRAEAPICRHCGCGLTHIDAGWMNDGGFMVCVKAPLESAGHGKAANFALHEPMPAGLRGAPMITDKEN